MSIFLAMSGAEVTACDKNSSVLETAKKNALFWRANVNFISLDLKTPNLARDSFDLVFCQGVLEHFSDAEILEISSRMLELAPVFVFSVPGIYYRHKDFGDERLLPEKHWRRLLEPAGVVSIRPYYSVRTKKNLLIKRPLMILGSVERKNRI